jgi:hypothetical protein
LGDQQVRRLIGEALDSWIGEEPGLGWIRGDWAIWQPGNRGIDHELVKGRNWGK